MSKYTSISISGPVASGTTTAAREVANKLSIEYQSAGDYFRQYMIEHGIDIYKKEDIPDKIDIDFDDEVKKTLKSATPIVFEGIYSGYIARDMKHVMKILLIADEKVRIKRALNRTHTHTETPETVRARDKSHDAKFRKLYDDENFLDPKLFDLVIDTTNISIEDTNKKILREFKKD